MERIREAVRSILLSEITRWKEEGVDFDPLADLKRWVATGGAYAHFADLNKVGINVRYSYTYPFGIHAYPLDATLLAEVESGTVRFAGDRKYIHILVPTHPSLVLRSSEVTGSDVVAYAAELGVEPPDATGSDGDRLMKAAKAAAGGDPVRWGLVFRKIAVDGYVDESRRVAVFFGKDTVRHVDTVINPHGKDRSSY